MAFKKNANTLHIWLPVLDDPKYPHQVAIGTDVESTVLSGDITEFSLDDPNPSCYPKASIHHNPPPGNSSIPYEDIPNTYPPSSYFLHLMLPRPKWIVGLSPVSCKVYKGNTPPSKYTSMPVGFRLFYERVGVPVLKSLDTPSFSYPLVFDPAPGEMQVEMFVSHSPYNFSDYGHPEATDDFVKLGKMFGLTLNIDFALPFMTGRVSGAGANRKNHAKAPKILNGPAKDCKAPTILLT
jgi:hypothetical protein